VLERRKKSSLASCSGQNTTALFTMGNWTDHVSLHFYTPFQQIGIYLLFLKKCTIFKSNLQINTFIKTILCTLKCALIGWDGKVI
jgi:hypothetical protein